jgi:hypothetical protein
MAPPSPRRARLLLAIALSAMLASWIAFRLATGICLEDALITYRYAWNLARGDGLVFNPGERVLGTTTPLWAVILAGAGLVTGPERIPLAASVLLLACGLATGLLVARALGRLGIAPAVAALAAFLCLAHPDVVVAGTGGMETALVLFFMAASLHDLAARRHRRAAATCALLVLTRLDGLAWVAVVAVWIALRERPIPWRAAGTFVLVLAPWLAFSTLYYGSPVPNTIAAKQVVSYAFMDSPHGARDLAAHFAWFAGATGGRVRYEAAGLGWVPLGVLLAFLLAGAAAAWAEPRRRLLLVLPAYAILTGALYWAGRAPRMFDWYLVPPLWCCLVLVAVGAGAAVRRATPLAARIVLGLVLVILAGHLAAATRWTWIDQAKNQRAELALRKATAEWLRENTPPDATVATEAIGYLGWYSGRPILDLAGLTSPEIVRLRREHGTPGRAFRAAVRELAPDVIVLRSFEVDANRAWHGGPLFDSRDDASDFAAHYRERKRFAPGDAAFWGPAGSLTVFDATGARP